MEPDIITSEEPPPSAASTEPLTALTPTDIETMSYTDLQERKQQVSARLKIISPPKVPLKQKKNVSEDTIPYSPKSDTHWDFMLKEMMWLAADFQSERKRQLGSGKKVATAVKQFHATKEKRRVKELAEAELKRRRLAAKLGRHVRGWWHKIERVIAYKQKVEGDIERRKAMNKQLVALVHQTERYGETLASNQDEMDDYYSNDEEEEDATENGRRKRQRRRLTIEEALAQANQAPARRSSKATVTDYARLHKQEDTDELYGETTSDSGSDGSFQLETYSTDDESTLLEAEARELAERRAREESDDDDDTDDASFYADPDELAKLREEAEMNVDEVVERFRQEAVVLPGNGDVPEEVESEEVSTRRVRFASNVEQPEDMADDETSKPTRVSRQRMAAATDPGNEADDDGDASDVEDFINDEEVVSDGSDEFQADADEQDDETTIAAEERLSRDMSAEEEISLLQQDGEMSIEDLRKMYAMDSDGDEEGNDDDEGDDDDASRTEPTGEDTEAQDAEMILNEDDAGVEDEFQPDAMEVDDETTMEAEERLGREMSHEQEMSLLRQEGEIPIEQLRAMYSEMANNSDDSASLESDAHSQSLREMLEYGGEGEDGNDEFRPDDGAGEVDDETTMEAEERLGREMSYQDEINLLKRESEMSVEELRLMYAGGGSTSDQDGDQSLDESILDEDDQGSENEFRPADDAVDDETTMEAEERLGREMSVEDEIALLQREGETPIEDLRAMYNQAEVSEASLDSDTAQQGRPGRKRLRPDPGDSDVDDDDGEAALKALEVAEEKARMTRATRPFLIAPWVKLREYQQIGLNWLVSVQTRRLNAILADEMVSRRRLCFRS